MEFIVHYLWPSIKVCFIKVFVWVAIIVTVIAEYIAVVALSWGIFLIPIFLIIDGSIFRAYFNYEEDKQRMKEGYIYPKYRDK